MAEFSGAAVDLSHLRSSISFGGRQGGAKGGLEGQLLLDAFRRVWKGDEQLDPLLEVGNRFHIGRTLNSTLACLLPVANGLLYQARLGVVMRQ